MAIVAKDDIILQVDSLFNFIQGNTQTYEFKLFRDFVGQALNLNEPTSIHAAIYKDGVRYLQFSSTSTSGISSELILHKSENSGRCSLTLIPQQTLMIPPGQLYMQVSVLYENYYPQPKVYVFPMIALGESIAGEGGIPNSNPSTGGTGSGGNNDGGGTVTSIFNGSTFTVEAVDGGNPTQTGKLTVNNYLPELVTSIVFRNLDDKESRITLLENFLKNRIGLEGVSGTITLSEVGDTNMYAIYKIMDWSRIDINPGDGDDQNTDGIMINVVLEDLSSGPGVTRQTFVIGQKLSYSLDAIGSSTSTIKEGINTYLDKNINPIATTGDSAPTGITITYSPYYDSYVMVEVNGISVEVGDGVKTKACYFSGNNGLTAVAIESIRSGDQLIWNGGFSGYDLEPGDQINLIYEVDVDDLR
jgi:hypothetical protein